jgi:transposase
VLALTCWLGGKERFSSSRKAVRFAGLDITVYSSDGKRSPDHAYYAQVKDRRNSKRAALSEARKIIRQACHILTELGDDALAA